jgi:large subunit ribosomal protein L10
MNRDQKAALVEELAEQIRSADAIFAVDYRGISVSQAADLRTRLREAQTRFRIVKNSLTERATDQAGADSLKSLLEGPTALAFVSGDAALAARALSDAGRTMGALEFKGGLMNGATLSAEDVRSIARLPSREVLQGQLVGTIAAPLTQLVRTLNALIAGIAVQLQQMAEQGLVGTGSSATSEATGAATGTEGDAEPARVASDAADSPAEPQAEAETDAVPEAVPQESEQTEPEAASDDDSEATKEE